MQSHGARILPSTHIYIYHIYRTDQISCLGIKNYIFFDKLMPKLYKKIGRILVFGQSSLITIYVNILCLSELIGTIYKESRKQEQIFIVQ